MTPRKGHEILQTWRIKKNFVDKWSQWVDFIEELWPRVDDIGKSKITLATILTTVCKGLRLFCKRLRLFCKRLRLFCKRLQLFAEK